MSHLLVQGYGCISSVLHAATEIGPAFTIGQPVPNVIAYKAIWDTGATNSAISSTVVQALGLKPTGAVLSYNAAGKKMVNTYSVFIKFPNGPGFSSVKVSEQILNGFDVLIGMDIIGAGDFQVTHVGGETILAFHIPSNN